MKAYIANDCSRGGHFGCTLVMETYREQFERVGIEEVMTPREADLVIVNGEGSLHHNQRKDLLEYRALYPTILINAVYDSNAYDSALEEFKYIAVRECLSAVELDNYGIPCEIVPDIILTNKQLNAPGLKYQFLGGEGFTDNTTDPNRFGDSGKSAICDPLDYIMWLASRGSVVCGRFHAAICCMVIGVPFTTWDSNTHKIMGLMMDADILHLHSHTQEGAKKLLDHDPELTRVKIAAYVKHGQKVINQMFENIAGGMFE